MKDLKEIEIAVAKELLRISAVFLSPKKPFTWASGIKSPIYCDNRLILSDVKARKIVENGLATLLKEKFPSTEILMGTATAGIAHAAIVADIAELPMGYVRSSNKDHGRSNRIEGKLDENQKTVVIEDLISTGGSSIEVVECLRENKADVLGLISIFTYNMEKAKTNMKDKNIEYYSLCNLDTLLEVAIQEQYISKAEFDSIIKFRNNPSDESWFSSL